MTGLRLWLANLGKETTIGPMKWFFGQKRSSRDAGWFRSKHLKVIGPDFWGKFEIFIDRNLHIAMFLPKADHSVHVLRGTMERATLHYTYNGAGKRTSAVTLFNAQIQWHLGPTEIQFNGLRLPDEKRRYLAEVGAAEPFEGTIDQAWIIRTVKGLQIQMTASQKEADHTPDSLDPDEELDRFAQLIRVHKDQVFGMRLLVTAFKRQLIQKSEISQALLDTYPDLRKQETEAIAEAKGVMQQVRDDMTRIAELRAHEFPRLQGNPIQDEMTAQAQIYVDVYERLFPGRNRGAFLSKEDHQRLIEEARKKLAGLQVSYVIEDYLPPARAASRVHTEEMQEKT